MLIGPIYRRNYNGDVEFSYLISDGTGEVSVRKRLTIEAVEDAPQQIDFFLHSREVAKITLLQ